MRLIDHLSKEFKIISGDKVVSGSDIAELINNPPDWTAKLKHKKIAIHTSAINFIQIAALLDGLAESILVVGENTCGAFIKRAEASINIDYIIVDSETMSSEWLTAKINISDGYKIIQNDFIRDVDTRWLLATSGTTSTPKIVSHPLASLVRTTNINAKADTWGLIYDFSRFAGVQVVLQAFTSGSILLAPSLANFGEAIGSLVKNNCTSLSATPSLWRKLLMLKESDGLDLNQVTLGGEIVDQNIINTLLARFNNAKLSHIYASTEAGVGFSVRDGRAGFPKAWLINGYRDIILATSIEKTLLIKNTAKGQHYIDKSGIKSLANDEGWIDTGDIIEVSDHRVYFKGRINGSINIGGNKVTPEEIEAEIMEVVGVSQVLVRGRNSSIAGQLLEALIVPDTNVSDFKCLTKKIKEVCADKLPKFKRPVFFIETSTIEVSPSGKIKR